MGVEKNKYKVLEFTSASETINGNDDNLSFSWIMELQQGDTIRLKVTAGMFSAGYDCNWTFNGKFVRNV